MKIDIFNTSQSYDLIYADPPWAQAKGGKKSARPQSSGTALDYPTISLVEIKGYLQQAQALAPNDHILFLWAIDKYLFEAEDIARQLGYKLHARMIWNKVTGIPAAFTVRYGHEYLLYFYHGKFIKVAQDQRGKIHTVFEERAVRHSQKPERAYEIIELLYPTTAKLELFARQQRPGWDCWGNEV